MQYKNIDIKDIKKIRVTWYGTTFFYKFLPKSIVKKIKFYYLRKIFLTTKGYKFFNNPSQSDLYYRIIEDLDDCNFKIESNKFSKIIFGENIINHEKILKQIILKFILNQSRSHLNISRSILFSKQTNNKLIYPLHHVFSHILEKNNIQINKNLSFIYWYFIIIFFYLIGILKILKILLNFFKSPKYNFKDSVYFANLPKETLDVDKNIQTKENFFTFILDYHKQKNLKLKTIYHSINKYNNLNFNDFNISYSNIYNDSLNFFEKINFVVWSIKAILLSFIDIFRGRWWHAFLLSEAAERQIVSNTSFKKLHKIYLFNQVSGYIFRPLWTYEAEKKGSEIVFYFYSLNYSPITQKQRRPPAIKTSSWNQYIVWNKQHEQYLKTVCKINFEVFYISPVFLITGMKDFIPPEENFITVFDIPPFRTVYQKSILSGSNLYNVDNCINFIQNIIEISSKNNLKVILKIKRLNSVIHSKYLVYLKNEVLKGNLLILHDSISTISLIKNSRLIISYPVTTTNKLADLYNIKNYYYLPTKDKLAKHILADSKILYQKKELANIFKDAF
tara:strand:- start:7651 stop:9333 length:1683 start_codon:yes stop_codon:yes gene_type:complete